MRGNPLKDKMARGETILGSMIFEFFSPGIAQMADRIGLDFVLYDTEHNGADLDRLRWQFAVHRGMNAVPLMRVRARQYQYVAQALDVGAMGIMVPMVNTAEEAAEIVRWCRYPPDGVRGAALGFAHDDYGPESPLDKMKAADARTLVMPQIETREGLDNVDAILAVPGVDMIVMGHFDLSNFMGIPGQFEHPDFLAGLERITAAARKHGKYAVRMAMSADEAAMWIGKGWNGLIFSYDVHAYMTFLGDGIRKIRETA